MSIAAACFLFENQNDSFQLIFILFGRLITDSRFCMNGYFVALAVTEQTIWQHF